MMGAQRGPGVLLTPDPKRRSRPSTAPPPKVSRAGRHRESGDLVPFLASASALCMTLGKSLQALSLNPSAVAWRDTVRQALRASQTGMILK